MSKEMPHQKRLDKIVSIVVDYMRVNVCSLYVLRPGDMLELFATKGLDAKSVHETFLRVGEGLVGEVALQRKPLAFQDAWKHPSFVYKPETKEKSFKSGKVLSDNNIEFAIMTDHPVIEQKHTLVQVALFVKEGLDELEALKAVTINAAKLCHIDDKVGSIKEGKDADIVIWSKHPLDIMNQADIVLLNGNVVVER